MTKPLVLCILDGVGINPDKSHNAVAMAAMPFYDKLLSDYPHSELDASGAAVGLPPGTMGNSEVGHITIGAGRIVNQFLRRFQIEDWDNNQPLADFIAAMKKSQGTVNLMGLMSDGKIHSDINDIIFIAKKILNAGLSVRIHFFADGRDTPPKSAQRYLDLLRRELPGAEFATITGRYYAMDRNQNMDRTMAAFEAIANGRAEFSAATIDAGLADAYSRGETDEFIKPTVILKRDEVASAPALAGGAACEASGGGLNKTAKEPTPGHSVSCPPRRGGGVCASHKIGNNDGILFCNYRSDRARQILRVLIGTGARMLCFSQYGEGLDEYCPALLPDVPVKNTLGDVLVAAGLSQLRIAETEKYNHATYFFDAERTIDFPNEEKVLIPSPAVATFDLQPKMSAPEITDALIQRLASFDVVILNYANGDMIGHTGILPAAVAAMETLDAQLARLVPAVLKLGGTILITADHGNAEKMWNDAENAPWTAHTTNKVPFIAVSNEQLAISNYGGLSDIAPTMLKILGIAQPAEMTGKSLV